MQGFSRITSVKGAICNCTQDRRKVKDYSTKNILGPDSPAWVSSLPPEVFTLSCLSHLISCSLSLTHAAHVTVYLDTLLNNTVTGRRAAAVQSVTGPLYTCTVLVASECPGHPIPGSHIIVIRNWPQPQVTEEGPGQLQCIEPNIRAAISIFWFYEHKETLIYLELQVQLILEHGPGLGSAGDQDPST